jgi:hypothetical protein
VRLDDTVNFDAGTSGLDLHRIRWLFHGYTLFS